jgi:hypothetical protein
MFSGPWKKFAQVRSLLVGDPAQNVGGPGLRIEAIELGDAVRSPPPHPLQHERRGFALPSLEPVTGL